MRIVIHINTHLSHQIEHGELFYRGFKRHGLDSVITADPEMEGDVHVISGPHYAKHFWLNHPHTILLDRCHYRGNPESVSIGWMDQGGGRIWHKGEGRPPPEIRYNASGDKTIFLAEYHGVTERADTIRRHPADETHDRDLIEVLREHRTAIGYNTSSLVTAALEGLDIVCKSKQNIMSQDNWLELLPYSDWYLSEIESGEVWEHLQSSPNQLLSLLH